VSLRLGREFLIDFWLSVYYSTVPDYPLWGRNATIVAEPILALGISDDRVVRWENVEALYRPSFRRDGIRDLMRSGMSAVDGSDLDQALAHLGGDLYEIGENPFCYPDHRLDRLFERGEREAIEWIDGFCHFHPTGTAEPSDGDRATLPRLLLQLQEHGKRSITLITIACRDHLRLGHDARVSAAAFAESRLRRANDVLASCLRLHVGGALEDCEPELPRDGPR
jgi:hypothetical protein